MKGTLMPGPSQVVEVIRHTYDAYEVVAYDIFGRLIRRRWFEHGRRRKEWALEQARQWAERYYLRFDETIYTGRQRSSGQEAAQMKRRANPLAQQLATARERLGITKAEAAKRASVSAAFWSLIEAGRRDPLAAFLDQRAKLERLAEAVGLTLEDLLGGR